MGAAGVGNHPFPQRLAKSDDFNEIAPAVEPFAERLSSSPGAVPALEEALAHGLGESAADGRAPARSSPGWCVTTAWSGAFGT